MSLLWSHDRQQTLRPLTATSAWFITCSPTWTLSSFTPPDLPYLSITIGLPSLLSISFFHSRTWIYLIGLESATSRRRLICDSKHCGMGAIEMASRFKSTLNRMTGELRANSNSSNENELNDEPWNLRTRRPARFIGGSLATVDGPSSSSSSSSSPSSSFSSFSVSHFAWSWFIGAHSAVARIERNVTDEFPSISNLLSLVLMSFCSL